MFPGPTFRARTPARHLRSHLATVPGGVARRRRRPAGQGPGDTGSEPASAAQRADGEGSGTLHPERYLDRRDDPVALALPDLGPALGGARRIFEDEAGEFGFTGILGELLGNDIDAAGWRGDRYRLWEDTGGATVLVALAAWESDGAAGAFAEAYARLLPKKHGLPASADPTWQAGNRAFGVERRGREVLLFEQVLAAALEALRRSVWQGRP